MDDTHTQPISEADNLKFLLEEDASLAAFTHAVAITMTATTTRAEARRQLVTLRHLSRGKALGPKDSLARVLLKLVQTQLQRRARHARP